MLFVYVIARAGVKFGINFTSCSEKGNYAVSLLRVEKTSLLLVLSQINTITSFVKVKISDFQTCFKMSSGFFALLTLARHAVKVENRSGLTFFCA